MTEPATESAFLEHLPMQAPQNEAQLDVSETIGASDPPASASPAAPIAHGEAPAGGTWVAAMPRQERHDLRNYVGQVIGYSELWLDDTVEEGDTELRADLERIHAAGKQILAMINTHVDPVHPRTASAFAAPVAVSPSDAAQSATSEATPAAPPVPPGLNSYLSHWRTSASNEEIAAAPAPPASAAITNPNDALRGEILIVDDNEANRELLCRRLEQQGHQTSAARDGQEALTLLQDRDFDVLLLDIIMPTLNGYEVLKRIKADDRLRHLPVIMISALDEMDSVIRCIEMGADDFLSKPFDPILLQARIGACLEKKRLRDREMELFAQVQSNYQRLKELETLRDDLTHMIVHDLRTPLTSLLTGLQTLEFSEHMDEGEREMLDISVSGGRTLLGMINDLLDVGKMEDGSLKLEKKPVEAAALVETALGQITSLARDKRIALIRDIKPALPPFMGDEEKLVRALVNLLGNALKFTPPDGTITVEVREGEARERGKEDDAANDTPSLTFMVRDTGEGIPPDAFERIFQKFGQVESRKAGRKMSTGLGLTFCKLVVEAHGGHIWVESELGVGSTFLFSLPVS